MPNPSHPPNPPSAPLPRRSRPAARDLVLNPAARLLWRGDGSVQVELGRRAVVVDGLTPDEVRLLTTRGMPDAALPEVTAHGLTALVDSGFLWPRTALDDTRLEAPHPRLAAELVALSARHGEDAAAVLAARRTRCVYVEGSGRTGPALAAVLAAAGVGRVVSTGSGDVRLHQTAPGGLTPRDEGREFRAAAADAVTRAAPDAATGPLPLGERPDLVVLAADDPVAPERRDGLHARQTAHLVVRTAADHGVVGPLVLPGLTSCLRCADLHRLDRDPAWPALAVQLTQSRRAGSPSSVAAAAMLAGVTALQVLAFLDGGEPAVIDGTLEVHLPGWRLRRRTWPVHPRCDCGA